MFKLIAALAVVALCLSGCETITAAVNGGIAVLSSPAATQAASNVKALTTGLTCFVGDAASIASTVEAQVSLGKAAAKDTQDVLVASTEVCNALGGAVVITAPASPSSSK